ncbi:MAG: BamA/TamA family outer membrane protein [Pirellulaceae bacterium]
MTWKSIICGVLLATCAVLPTGCRSMWNRSQDSADETFYIDKDSDSDSPAEYHLPFDNRPKKSMDFSATTEAQLTPVTETQTRQETKIVRGQDPSGSPARLEVSGGEFSPQVPAGSQRASGSQFVKSPQQDPQVAPASYQYPELSATRQAAPNQIPTERLGSPNEMNQLVSPFPPGVGTPGNYFNQDYADVIVSASEAQTGRINIGGAYNSENGLVGQFVIDERNFDIRRFPRGWRDITDGTAFRGAGQGFRLELVPGNQVQRYMVNFTEPYLFDTPISLSLSAFYFTRNYFDWDEQRLGGRIGLGYRLTPDLSVSLGLRMEDVKLYDPRVNTSPQLNADLGSTDLFVGQFSIVNDTRDHPFLPTDGTYFSLSLSQAFGEVSFPRADIEMRKYRLMYERADHSGRHTLSFGTKLGFSGSDTPIFENYFAGGFSTMRGFNFRGMGPVEGGVRVGGEFQWLNTVEYMFPLTPDDMIRGVTFVDFGTVEEDTRLDWDSFRVAPGVGLRVHMPAAGMGGAPLAFDFAFPINKLGTDDRQIFSFYMGFTR